MDADQLICISAYNLRALATAIILKVVLEYEVAKLKLLFKALRKAGYHMYQVYEYGSWMGYICDKKPFHNGGREVVAFYDFID